MGYRRIKKGSKIMGLIKNDGYNLKGVNITPC